MRLFLVILLVALMIATVAALVRGIIAFLSEATSQVRDGSGPSPMALKSNQMMQKRILYQALAIVIVVLLLMSAHGT